MVAGMITLILIGLKRGIRTHRTLVLENLALRLSRLETSPALASCRGDEWTCGPAVGAPGD
jgi:hypothetical protein